MSDAAAARIAEHRTRAVAALARELTDRSRASEVVRSLGLPDPDARRRLFAEVEAKLCS